MSATETLRAPRGQSRAAGKQATEKRDHSSKPDRTAKPEAEILFQNYFKSGERTYAAQVKRAARGNHFLVLTEGKRDPDTDALRKSWVLVWSDDFPAFFRMLQETARFIKGNPVPEEVRRRRAKWLAEHTKPAGR
jgi:hypothetical protein